METSTLDVASILQDNQVMDEQAFQELLRKVRGGERSRLRFREGLEAEIAQREEELAGDAALAFKMAQSFFALGDFEASLSWLDQAGGGSAAQMLLKAQALRALKRYDEAIAAYEQAESKGSDSFRTAMEVVACLREKGDLDEAQQRLKRVSRVGEIRAEYHYQLGRLHEAHGRHEEAMSEYEQAIALDANHIQALFHLAYAIDLYGDEEEAIGYYEKCVETGHVMVAALLNLAVLYEDMEEYARAARCARQVLAAYPNHARARMFLKDIEASKVMYFDEEQERRIDRTNKVLEIPISDFELSVRSRNCLKKMNIRYLGDLLRVTESELLAYKNFGETSLLEVKAILNQKGLRLGQLVEDRGGNLGDEEEPEEPEEEVDELATMPVDELALSVRARKCLQRLNLETVGELVRCTEAELLGCKNFGQTSLTEIKQRLEERGLALRELD